MNWLLVLAFLFFAGCIIGWGIELVFRRFFSMNNPEHKWINPGFLMGPYLPIYGFGLLGMYCISELLSSALTGNDVIDAIIILVLMALVMTAIEYVAGIVFIKRLKIKLWDYTDEKFNIQGVICLKFTIFWGILGCFYYFIINPYVLDGIYWLSQHLTFSFFIGAFFGIFGVDVVYSLSLMNKLRAFAEENEIIIKYEELKQDIAKRREEFEEKNHFLMVFKSDYSLRSSLEEYANKQREKFEKTKAELEEGFEKTKSMLEDELEKNRLQLLESFEKSKAYLKENDEESRARLQEMAEEIDKLLKR